MHRNSRCSCPNIHQCDGEFAKGLGDVGRYFILLNNLLDLITLLNISHSQEVSSYRIQSTLLDQTRVVTNGQSLVVWINAAMFLVVNVERLNPKVTYGKLGNFTEVHIAPYKSIADKIDEVHALTTQQMLDRIPRRSASTNSMAVANGYRNSFNGFSKDTPTALSPLHETPPKPVASALEELKRKKNTLNWMIEDLQKNTSRSYEFRILSSKWDDSQMSDLFATRQNLPSALDVHQVFRLKTSENREYFVNLKVLGDQECFPKNIYPTIEMNDALLNKLALKPFERITLRRQQTAVNSIERIELYVNRAADVSRARDLERLFKQLIIDAGGSPFLINQCQVFRLEENVYVTATIHPDVLRFGCVDSAGLRMCRISCSDQVREVIKVEVGQTNGTVVKANGNAPKTNGKVNGIEKSASFVNLSGHVSGHEFVELDKFEEIVDQVVEQCKIALCLDERNVCRTMGNVIVAGEFKYLFNLYQAI